MIKILRWTIYIAAALTALLVIAAIALVYFFNPNDYKSEITRQVSTKYQRTLTLDGDLKLTLFPQLGINIGKAALSEANNGAAFASIHAAHVSLALLPLLQKQVLIDKIEIDGLSANIIRDKNGHSNVDDLKSSQATQSKASEQKMQIALAGLMIRNSSVRYRDASANIAASVNNINADIGRIADKKSTPIKLSADINATEPKADFNIALDGNLQFDSDSGMATLDKLNLALVGSGFGIKNSKLVAKANAVIDSKQQSAVLNQLSIVVSGVAALKIDTTKLTLSESRANADGLAISMDGGADKMSLNFSTPRFNFADDAIHTGSINGNATLPDTIKTKFSAADISGKLNAFIVNKLTLELDTQKAEQTTRTALNATVRGNVDRQTFDFQQLVGESVIHNTTDTTVKYQGALQVDLKNETTAANLDAIVDDSKLHGNINLAHFSKPKIEFDLTADQFNLDRYLPPVPKGDAANANIGAVSADSNKPIDLSAIKYFSEGVSATGKLQIAKLQAQNMKFQDVSIGIRAADSRIDLNPISLKLYQGSLAGSLSVNAKNDIVAKQTLSNVDVNPLLTDALNRDVLEGRGNVALDIKTSGANVDALKRNLAGTASLNLRDGAVKGINLAQKFRQFKSMIGGKTDATESANKNEKTDFSELTASFNIANGVAKSDDLAVKSPFLRIGGSGEIDVAKQQINYTVKSTVVNTATGQDGKDLAQLKDITIPVLLSGPFNQLSYRIQWSAIASKVLQQKLNDKINEKLFGKPSETKLGEAESGANKKPEQILKDKLQEKLKGLFGR